MSPLERLEVTGHGKSYAMVVKMNLRESGGEGSSDSQQVEPGTLPTVDPQDVHKVTSKHLTLPTSML